MSAKNSKNAGLAVVANVERAPQMIDILQKELSKLTKVSETPFKISGSININGSTIDIKNETNIQNLIMVMSAAEMRSEHYNKAAEGRLAKSLNGTFPVFSISGYSLDDIAHDVNLKIEVISYSERKKELEELVARGKEFLTKEDQFQLYLSEVAKKFGSKD